LHTDLDKILTWEGSGVESDDATLARRQRKRL